MTVLRIIDVETTGLDPVEDRVCEIAFVDVSYVNGTWRVTNNMGESLVNPWKPISPEASAIHHIIDQDVIQKPRIESVIQRFIHKDDDVTAYVAHNAAFDQAFLGKFDARERPWICTFKAALRVWPDFDKHSNQYLRYKLKLPVSRDAALLPHRALSDAFVTAHLLVAILNTGIDIEQLIAWSELPPLFVKVSFGQHRGTFWSDLPDKYLMWIIDESKLDADTKWNAKYYLTARQRPVYADAAVKIIKGMKSVEQLKAWWVLEQDHRDLYWINDDTPEYQTIVTAAATRKAELKTGDPV